MAFAPSDGVRDERLSVRGDQIIRTQQHLRVVDRGRRRLDIHPRVRRHPELVAPERVLDRDVGAGLGECTAELAHDRSQGRAPRSRRCPVPEDVRDVRGRQCVAALQDQQGERETALTARQPTLGHQRVTALERHIAGEVDP
jgi:hypothetical protein